MIISFNTGKIETKGGGNLQQKKVTVTENGLDVIVPDAGYDGFSTVYVKTAVGEGGSSYKDFSVIGYDDETSIMLNNEIDDDIAYSKSLYDAWNPENTNARSFYYYDTELVYAPAIDVSNVTDAGNMFGSCSNLYYVPAYSFNSLKNADEVFINCSNVVNLNLSNWNMSNVKQCLRLCKQCTSLKTVDVTGWDLTNYAYSMDSWFYGCSSLAEIKGVENWFVPKVTSLYSMFYGCSSLTSLELSNWVTNSITNLYYTFYGCKKLVSLDISSWNLTNVTNTSSIFNNCNDLTNLQFGYDIKCSISFSYSTKLTVESLLSVLNGLYDFTGNGETPTSTQGRLTLGTTNLAKLTDEQKAIATGKGWVLN